MGIAHAPAFVSSTSACAFCGGQRERLFPVKLWSQDRWLMRCQRCGACTTDTPLADEELLDSYAGSYFAREEWQLAKARALARDYAHKAVACGLAAPGARCLEIGAGYGFFAAEWQATTGAAVDVLEISRDCQDFIAHSFPHLRHLGRTLADLPADSRYDLIFCFHVAEHVAAPADFLRDVARHLNPGGRIMILTPNALSRGFVAHGKSWGWSCPNQHCTFLSPRIPEAFFAAAGFRVVVSRSVRPALIHTPSSFLVRLDRWHERLSPVQRERLSLRNAGPKLARRLCAWLAPQFQQNDPGARLLAIERFLQRWRGATEQDELLLVLQRDTV